MPSCSVVTDVHWQTYEFYQDRDHILLIGGTDILKRMLALSRHSLSFVD